MYSHRSILVPTHTDLVSIDQMSIEDEAWTDGKLSLALMLWRCGAHELQAIPFVQRLRRLYAREPAHLLDTSHRDMQFWDMIDFQVHSFVMDGGNYANIRMGTLKSIPARIAAEQTYGLVVTERRPMLFHIDMRIRSYDRALFPFFARNGQVTRVATLVRPLLTKATLAEVSSVAAHNDR